jgi:hypothetical protein
MEQADAAPYRSDTGELAWAVEGKNSGFVAVDTERSQALIGYCAKNKKALKNLSAELTTPFCAITLSSLDAKPISASAKLLLTTTARAANTGMMWNEKRTSLENWGSAPTTIEAVSGKVLLRNLDAARQVTAQPLNGAGEPLGKIRTTSKTEEGWSLSVGELATTWYIISVAR